MPALGKLRQKACQEFESSLYYTDPAEKRKKEGRKRGKEGNGKKGKKEQLIYVN